MQAECCPRHAVRKPRGDRARERVALATPPGRARVPGARPSRAAVLDHHPLEHGADELLPGVEVERGERTANGIGRGLQVGLELCCPPVGVQHLDAPGDVGPPLPQPCLTLPEEIEVDESGLIGVEQSVFPRDPVR